MIWQKMKKNMSWKFTDEWSITFQSSVSGPAEFGLRENKRFFTNFSTYHVEKVISGEDYFVGREGFTDDPKVIFQGN